MSTKDRDGRRLRVRGTIITGVGIVAAAAAVWFTLGLLVYLAALGVVAIGLVHLSAAMQRFRDRGIGLTLSALIVVVAVAVPWGIATVERTGVARWVVPTAGDASYTYSDGSRVLFLDDDGIHAVDLRDGSVLWSHEGPSARGSFHVAADGHVLVHYGLGGTTRKVSWISPDGEVLWNVDTMGTSDADILSDDVVFRNPRGVLGRIPGRDDMRIPFRDLPLSAPRHRPRRERALVARRDEHATTERPVPQAEPRARRSPRDP